MERPWLKHYGSAVPETIDLGDYQNIMDMMIEASNKYSDRTAFSNFGATLSYREVDDLSRNFAAYLQSTGFQKGDRVALMSPNHLAFPVAMFGILRAGGVQVSVNPLYTAAELEYQLNDADVETIVVFSGSTATLAEIKANTRIKQIIVINLNDLIDRDLPSPPTDERIKDFIPVTEALKLGASREFKPVEISPEDLIFLQYTGGTTGLSKAAMLTHGNLLSNILQFEAFMRAHICPGEEVIITALPLFHIFALMANALTYFRFGATNVLITNPRDMTGFVDEWSQWSATVFTGVNTLFNGLLHTPGFDDLDFSSLRLSIGGGAPVQKAVSEKWKEVTGRHIVEAYGLSETSPLLTANLPGQSGFRSSIGIPVSSTDVSLRDDNGNVVAIDKEGELCAKGPQIMVGYWGRDDATSDVMTDDNYFRTGDIATMDEDGYFYIVDRKKDMILVSGFNVYPNEIEALVAQMPGVMESACIGVPDESTGEAVKLFIVRHDDSLTEEQVRDFCRESLTAYKVPKQVEFLSELPKSTVGKILRRKLR